MKTDLTNLPPNLYHLDERDWIVDTETNALKDYTAFWNAVFRNVKTDEVVTFRNLHEDKQETENLERFCQNIRYFIGHNIVKYDSLVFKKFTCVVLSQWNTIDTLILSKLLNYKRKGGHSVEAFGETFGEKKSSFSDFSQYSKELEARCISDTAIQRHILGLFERHLLTKRWVLPIYLEHTIEYYNRNINSYGFYYDIDKHKILLEELKNKVGEYEEGFKKVFSSEFNPKSPKQRVDVLTDAGWKPVNKTDGHLAELRKGKAANPDKLEKYKKYGWKTDVDNLLTLPDTAPEAAKTLKEYLIINARLSVLNEWERAYNPLTHAVHPTINGIGSWTHRRSHQDPNSANIPALINRQGQIQPYGKECRSLWTARPNRLLVGTDAESIQLRVFAHYVEDEKLIKAVAEGRKEDKTDIHNLNKDIIGIICRSRETAKTYIYAKFLGAAIPKIAEILQCTKNEAIAADKRIMDFYPGWKKLKEKRIPADAKRGYFEGLDGRYVFVPSEHHVLAGYLQNGESVIMKCANILWTEKFEEEGIDAHQVNDVHDEWQTDVLNQGNLPRLVGEIQTKAIEEVGRILKLNCPLSGTTTTGINWAETH